MVRKITFDGGLKITRKNDARFSYLILGQGINGSSFGYAYVFGYGGGGSYRYHAVTGGNFVVTINDKSFTITCSGGLGIQAYLINFDNNADHEIESDPI